MQSYTEIYSGHSIGFRIMNTANDGLCLVDFSINPMEFIQINSANEGKAMAQRRFEQICDEIIGKVII